ncbi:MAG: S66 peptidase family protein [Candidatus Binatia bacterium]
MPPLKPPCLKKGAKIGVLAPAGSVQDGQLNAGVNALLRAGFDVELAKGIRERKGYLAGDKEKRARALLDFFQREDVEAVFCARGGFGSIQLLPLLDAKVIHFRPKIFVGYSDVSILLNWLLQKCGLVVFHGPMVTMEIAQGLEGRSEDFFWGTLLGEKRQWKVRVAETVRPGVVEAEMLGGCLSTIVTTLGTPYEIETKGKILFLEDIGERPYRIERMLTHLQMAGKLEGIAALVFGSFTDCEGEGEREVEEIIQELFHDVSYPVVAGLAAGHGEENLLLPFGVKMRLDGKARVLSMLESPVV